MKNKNFVTTVNIRK